MTSKDFFNVAANRMQSEVISSNKKGKKQIENDLEVLETLKSHAKLTELNSVNMGYPKTIVIAIDPKDDDYETVKRWLENEN